MSLIKMNALNALWVDIYLIFLDFSHKKIQSCHLIVMNKILIYIQIVIQY